VPDLLEMEGSEIIFEALKAGDYLVNHEILIERKSAEDFVQSLLNGRLFDQCNKLRNSGHVCLMIVEGDPNDTQHKMSVEAIQGALLSVMISWEIPLYFAKDKQETATAIIRAGLQNTKRKNLPFQTKTGAGKNYGSQVYFLQSLPDIGPQLSLRLLRHFGSIASIASATTEELQSLEGIGAKKAERLVDFFSRRVIE
jgi:Fanconi anemia group M protein